MSIFKKYTSSEKHANNIKNINSNGSITINQASGNAKINTLTPERKTAKIVIVDIFDSDKKTIEESPQPTVELKLLNSGDEVAFVKEIGKR
ncbi:hypothetical protein SAMN05216214_1292 [Atopomonas hussainii]|uniref:Uncharacterized protein n=2 Tax=Atopomonas hussainii TaxID=1429083 RepID=A0A1H7THA8_9GAMM|nr:hypothetical protein SAMN05216214_1292 [Atopomonas hussainii]